jgi:hypothetical protein
MTLIDTFLTRDQIERETDKAYLFAVTRRIGGGQLYSRHAVQQVWLPKSKVTWVDSVYGQTAHIPAWLAAKL